MNITYGTPVVGITLAGRILRGAWLEERYTDDIGTWHLVAIRDHGTVHHALVEVCDVRVDRKALQEMVQSAKNIGRKPRSSSHEEEE